MDKHEQNAPYFKTPEEWTNHDIQIISSALEIKLSTIQKAKEIFKEMKTKNKIQGHSNYQITLASLYMAIRFNECVPISLNLFCEIVGINRFDLFRGYKIIRQELDVLPKKCYINPLLFANSFAKKLQLSTKIRLRIKRVCNALQKKRYFAGKSPIAVASAVIYLVCKLEGNSLQQNKIAELTGVTEITIKHHYDKINKLLDLE